MGRGLIFTLFFAAIFLQAGAYGLTFMLPKLFANFGASEKTVGVMLMVTTFATLTSVYFAGHLADRIGRVRTLGAGCLAISLALFLFGIATSVGMVLTLASLFLGAGWGVTYSLAPVVLSGIVAPEERVRYFALLSVFVMAGFGLAPVLASFLEGRGFPVATAFMLNSGLCFISAGLFFGLTGGVHRLAPETGPQAASKISLSSLVVVFRSRALVPVIMVMLGASVFAGMSNFQTVFAEQRGLDYALFFLIYTVTVIAFRLVLVRFKGGENPYRTIAILQYIMAGSVLLFIISGSSFPLYAIVAFLFGIGYGVSYPILVAMAANDADPDLGPQTLQLFALTYFVGVFGFPLVAGWTIVELGTTPLLILVFGLAVIEASMALKRAYS